MAQRFTSLTSGRFEVTNALVKALRRRQITKDELLDYARQLASLRAQVDVDQVAERTFDDVLALAERYQLTTYDASYLELAQRRGLPLRQRIQI